MDVTKDCSVLVANYLVYALQYKVNVHGSNVSEFMNQYRTTFQFVEGQAPVKGETTTQKCLMVFTLEVPCKLVCIIHESEWLVMDWDGQIHVCDDRQIQSHYQTATFTHVDPSPRPTVPDTETPITQPNPIDTSKGPSDVPWPAAPTMELRREGLGGSVPVVG